jgi:hypothetical protein
MGPDRFLPVRRTLASKVQQVRVFRWRTHELGNRLLPSEQAISRSPILDWTVPPEVGVAANAFPNP